MAKSRRFKPGDSAPDFSHLADHDQQPDEAESPLPGGQPAAPRETPPNVPAGPSVPGEDSAEASAADDEMSTPPAAGGSHVFFDAGPALSEDALAGETTAMPPRENDPEDAGESPSTGLTAVGFPKFDAAPPPEPPSTEGQSGSPVADAEDIDTQETQDGIPCFAGVGAETREERAEDLAGRDTGAKPPASPPDRSGNRSSRPRKSTTAGKSRPQSGRRSERVSSPAGRETPSPAPEPDADRRRLMMILLASYASAVTIACLWMWMTRNTARTHDLESLPDVAPLDANEFRFVPQNASMPNGHTLPLGGRQQLGHLQVEPLRITRGPVRFAHYDDPDQSRPPTEPVLKLWLRFTNVSTDQLIAPLDAELLLTRSYQVETDTVLANQLVLPADKSAQKPAYVIDHPATSEWDLAGQQLGRRLAPGESVETYIPLQPESAEHLSGDLLWRIHFRKGYHDQTGHGVTTMIEVPFSTSDVQAESSAS